MRRKRKQTGSQKSVEAIIHGEASRKNIPTAEYESILGEEQRSPIRVVYERRNRDLDPQLVWQGKDDQNWSDLVVQAPPLYIQEKVHPKVLIDDLMHQSKATVDNAKGQIDLFADFNGIKGTAEKTEFYQHDANWTNRMILGDSLKVMASLAEREGLRGQVQCIYIDPPYGIKFNSNFQWSTTSRNVTDGKREHITREPEQVKAFRDTWRNGIHSYLTYLRDRLTVARDLLAESGSIFVQIGDENVHRVRALMDEVFGEENFISEIVFAKTRPLVSSNFLTTTSDFILWYAKDRSRAKMRTPRRIRGETDLASHAELWDGTSVSLSIFRRMGMEDQKSARLFMSDNLERRPNQPHKIIYQGRSITKRWRTTPEGMRRLIRANRVLATANSLRYKFFLDDYKASTLSNVWSDTSGAREPVYVVQTNEVVIQRCILMTTDPGDLVLDPTCGSGTTAYVAEQWGRRWITIDTSRVALALARSRIMGARYPYYMLADSPEGQQKEAEIARTTPAEQPTQGDIRQGFVYQRVPHITLRDIAHNTEIDIIWEQFQERLEILRHKLNQLTGRNWEEWEIPRHPGDPWPEEAADALQRARNENVSKQTRTRHLKNINRILGREYTLETLPDVPVDPWSDQERIAIHTQWWELRIERQKEIDASIASKAGFEYLYDQPYEDSSKVRVAGPFTVESLSPHRFVGMDENDELIDHAGEKPDGYRKGQSFTDMILENLKTAGVQQASKKDRITFTSLKPWPGELIVAEGRYTAGNKETGLEMRAGIFIGPEFGTVSRPDLVEAAREAADADFDILIACAFSYDAHSTELNQLGRIRILKARMNADLHMAADLRNTDKGNLFVIFGEPDIDILDTEDGQIQVKINGVDVFDPNSGEIRSDDTDGIACWFVDTDYNQESFFARQAYFLGANDPYKALKTTLKAEINTEAWETLHKDISRPFPKPESGRIAVKVINHLGDEVMKVFRVQ